MMRRNNPPQAKRRPQPKKASAPPRRAPQRAHPKRQDTSNTRHLLSPLTTQLVPSLAFQGEAFPYTGLVRHEVNAPITNKVIFFATNVGTSATCLMELRWDANGAGTALVGVKNVFTIPTLINADDTGGPTSMRPMKAGMTIVNRTQLLSRGGPVYTLNLNSRIRAAKPPSTMTVADAEALLSTLIAHPDCHSMDAVDFGKPRHMYSHVVDDPAYNNSRRTGARSPLTNFSNTSPSLTLAKFTIARCRPWFSLLTNRQLFSPFKSLHVHPSTPAGHLTQCPANPTKPSLPPAMQSITPHTLPPLSILRAPLVLFRTWRVPPSALVRTPKLLLPTWAATCIAEARWVHSCATPNATQPSSVPRDKIKTKQI